MSNKKKSKKQTKLKINPEIFRGYDIRGIAGQDLSPAIVKKIIKAYAYELSQRKIKQAVVGYDCRQTSKEYAQSAIEAFTESGIDVINIGLSLVQMVYFAQYYFQINGAVMITASHNPKEYNGMKLALGYSNTMIGDEIQKIKRYAQEGRSVIGKGKAVQKDITNAYFKDLLKRVNIKKKFKVVIDASNTTAGKFMPKLLEKAGCDVIEQNCDIDPEFPSGTPDPTEERIMTRLSGRVLGEKADLGFTYDADGDRIGVVDDKGEVFWNDSLIALFADGILADLPEAKIVYNSLCSRIVEETIKEAGGKPIMWRTGHSYIKEKVQIERAIFGGELSGHFFFFDNFYGHDDGSYATLRVLEYLSNQSKKPSQVFEKFKKYISSPEIKVGCPDDKKVAYLEKLRKQIKKDFKDGKFFDFAGIRVDWPDAMMVIRCSDNGPYITTKFEAMNQKKYDQLKKYIQSALKKSPEVDWSYGVNIESLK